MAKNISPASGGGRHAGLTRRHGRLPAGDSPAKLGRSGFAAGAHPGRHRTARRSCLPVLADRAVLAVTGPDAVSFLAGLLTCAVGPHAGTHAHAVFGALLNPQGRVLFDFLLVPTPDCFLLDVARDSRDGLVKRLGFYKLRARVAIAAADHAVGVVAPAAAPPPAALHAYADPRRAELGTRLILPAGGRLADGFDAEAARIGLAVPKGGADFAYGDVYPADVNMDALGGVDFGKGCFVGQEVVARMKHRGTPRWRTLAVRGAAPLPAAGTAVEAGGKPVGTLGTSLGGIGLALMRIDRVAEARHAGVPLVAAGAVVEAALPVYAGFGWPDGAAAD
jgi:folate-binding protein YgfZ